MDGAATRNRARGNSPHSGTTLTGTRLPAWAKEQERELTPRTTLVRALDEGQSMPDIHAMTKQLSDQLKRESDSLELWKSFEPVEVTDQRRKTFNVRSEMITRCKLNIQKYRETIAALEEQADK
jgi:hypothetical protein